MEQSLCPPPSLPFAHLSLAFPPSFFRFSASSHDHTHALCLSSAAAPPFPQLLHSTPFWHLQSHHYSPILRSTEASILTFAFLVRYKQAALPFFPTCFSATRVLSGNPCEPPRGSPCPALSSPSASLPFPIPSRICRLLSLRPAHRPLLGALALPRPLLAPAKLLLSPLRSARQTTVLSSNASGFYFGRQGQAILQRSAGRFIYSERAV